MVINFQYNSLYVLAPGEALPDGCAEMSEDGGWNLCFRRLSEGAGDIAVRCRDVRRLMDYLHTAFINVKAAGGIVEDCGGRRLLMVRNDRCDLPKGKVEEGETLAQAALRETTEETGLAALALGPLLLKTYHVYDLYGGWHFKQTSWFAMKALETSRLVPQTEEGITDLRWLSVDEWRSGLASSYATMRIINAQVPDGTLVRLDG